MPSLLSDVVVSNDGYKLHRWARRVRNRGRLLDVRVVVLGVDAAGCFVDDGLLAKLLDEPG